MNKRQPSLSPDELDSEQRALYDKITSGPRRGGPFDLTDEVGALAGPFGGFLLSPPVGDALQQLGAAIRFGTALSDRLRELAILTVAHHARSDFEWMAHEAIGRQVGLSDAEMAAIASGREPELPDAAEAAGVRFTRALLEGDVSDDVWSTCVPELTLTCAYELIVLVGYYSTLALQMRVLRVDTGD